MANLIGAGAHAQDLLVIWSRVRPKNILSIYDDDSQLGYYPLIDPSVVIGINIELGKGSVVAPLSCLLRDVRIGKHTHINYNVGMTRCVIDDFTTVCPGAVICGDVTIGKRCLIGANATICDRTIIGDDVTIAAGAIVPPLSNIPDETKVIGVWHK